jgi:hypothetical protein
MELSLVFKFSGCTLIPSTPSFASKMQFLVQVTVLGFSYLYATWHSKIFFTVYIEGIRLSAAKRTLGRHKSLEEKKIIKRSQRNNTNSSAYFSWGDVVILTMAICTGLAMVQWS